MLLEDFSILDFGVRNDASLELGREEAGTPIQFRNTQRVPDSGMRNHTHCEFRMADFEFDPTRLWGHVLGDVATLVTLWNQPCNGGQGILLILSH